LAMVGNSDLDPTQNLFRAAPAIIEPKSPTPAHLSLTLTRFPPACVLELYPKVVLEPNLWVPRKIEMEWCWLPMSEAQGKTKQRWSLLRPQRRATGRPFFPTLHKLWAPNE
jgi:hypothetical protein